MFCVKNWPDGSVQVSACVYILLLPYIWYSSFGACTWEVIPGTVMETCSCVQRPSSSVRDARDLPRPMQILSMYSEKGRTTNCTGKLPTIASWLIPWYSLSAFGMSVLDVSDGVSISYRSSFRRQLYPCNQNYQRLLNSCHISISFSCSRLFC